MRELLEDVYPILKLLVTFNTKKVQRDRSHRFVLSHRINEASRSLSKLGGKVASRSPPGLRPEIGKPRIQMMSAYALATAHSSLESSAQDAPNSALPKVVEEEPLHFGMMQSKRVAPS